MRSLANALFCLAILSTIQLGRAAPVDPQISVGDPVSGTPLSSPMWSFKSDANGGGIFAFINETKNVWQTLDFFATLPAGDTISCSSTLFGLCDYTSTPAGNGQRLFDVGFEQPDNGTGVGPKGTFSIDLNDSSCGDKNISSCGGGWGSNSSIEGVANFGLPEPATWALTAAGLLLCGFCAIHRRAT